jgi:hypothetical protein
LKVFQAVGLDWVADIVAIGVTTTLTANVFTTLMAQPRFVSLLIFHSTNQNLTLFPFNSVFYQMARDVRLLPFLPPLYSLLLALTLDFDFGF